MRQPKQMSEYDSETLRTPVYVCKMAALRRNLEIFKSIKQQCGVTVLLALKGFAMSSTFSMVSRYLDGCCASGLNEALLAHKMFKNDTQPKKAIHTYSVAYKEHDIDSIAQISSHIAFNSMAEFQRYHARVKAANPDIKLALRLNPQYSRAPVELYNPCAPFSRLGITIEELQKYATKAYLPHIDGVNFHALCEEGADALEAVLEHFETQFSFLFNAIRFVNFGGGHHITKAGYDIEHFIQIVKGFKSRYPHLEVIIEPGEAIGWQAGVLVATVLDIVHNDMDIAILDLSAEAHMPDTLAMPYRAEVRHAACAGEKPYTYRLAGNTCLAGDIMGDYSFEHPLQRGERIIFEDQIHYTFVKNTTFNGVALPSLALLHEDGTFEVVKSFGYEAYASRL